MNKALLVLFLLVGVADRSLAGYPTEVQWAEREANWSRYDVPNQQHVEWKLWDGTRCDWNARKYAIEIDWAKSGKWAEAVGQALYYAQVLDKKPGIVLLIKEHEKVKAKAYVYRCQTVCAREGIRLWTEIVEEE